jgi:hypothetical protein
VTAQAVAMSRRVCLPGCALLRAVGKIEDRFQTSLHRSLKSVSAFDVTEQQATKSQQVSTCWLFVWPYSSLEELSQL